MVARRSVPMGSIVPFLPLSMKPGKSYEETIIYPGVGEIDIDVALDKETYIRKGSVKLELTILNRLSVNIEGLTAAVTNHVLVEGAYLDINPGMRGKVLTQEFSKRSGDETVVEFSDIMSIVPSATLKRTYKMEVPLQVWPTCIIGASNSHPFWIRCYIDICFNLGAIEAKHIKTRASLAPVVDGDEGFGLVGDDERGIRIPLFVVDDPDEEESAQLRSSMNNPNAASSHSSLSASSSLVAAGIPFSNRGPVTWSEADQCAVCDSSFSIFRWKHHCRACGQSVCTSCSAVQPFPYLFGSSSQRICTPCHAAETNNELMQDLPQNLRDSAAE